mmetsp:Transcript_25973/g.52095  ORF Transcript_25973/g.52095 Transcript_25973/m.52095 type:complete len:207 (+) Transcript_25973:735-1355(+)
MDCQRVTRLVTGPNESLSHHSVPSFIEFTINFIVFGVTEGGMGTCTSGHFSRASDWLPISTSFSVTKIRAPDSEPQCVKSGFTLLIFLLVNCERSSSIEVIVQRWEALRPFPFTRLLFEVFFLQGQIDAHVFHFDLGNKSRNDSANLNNIFSRLNVIICEVTERNETRDVTLKFHLRSKVTILHHFTRNFLTRTKSCISLASEESE